MKIPTRDASSSSRSIFRSVARRSPSEDSVDQCVAASQANRGQMVVQRVACDGADLQQESPDAQWKNGDPMRTRPILARPENARSVSAISSKKSCPETMASRISRAAWRLCSSRPRANGASVRADDCLKLAQCQPVPEPQADLHFPSADPNEIEQRTTTAEGRFRSGANPETPRHGRSDLLGDSRRNA